MGTEIAVQGDLRLGADPAPDPVTADQHDEGTAGIHLVLQAVEPELTLPDALIVLEHGKSVLGQLEAQVSGRFKVIAAVTHKDVMPLRHCVAPPAMRLARQPNLTDNFQKGQIDSEALRARHAAAGRR